MSCAYELPNLQALNFLLPRVLDGGGSLTLRTDAQGKALGQSLLEMRLDVPGDALPARAGNASGVVVTDSVIQASRGSRSIDPKSEMRSAWK